MTEESPGPGIMVFAGLGLLNAICLFVGIGIGWVIDHFLGTLPVFLMVGLVAGVVLGVLATRAELRRH